MVWVFEMKRLVFFFLLLHILPISGVLAFISPHTQTSHDSTRISTKVIRRKGKDPTSSTISNRFNLPPGYGEDVLYKMYMRHDAFSSLSSSATGKANHAGNFNKQARQAVNRPLLPKKNYINGYENKDRKRRMVQCQSTVSPDNNNFQQSQPEPELPSTKIKGKGKWSLDKYDGDAIEDYYNRNWWEVVDRLASIAPPMVSWYLGIKADNLTNPFIDSEVKSQRELKRAIQLREALISSKSVTFIKSGQALALRGDLLKSQIYVNELQKLQDEVGTFDQKEAMQIICEELKCQDPKDIYDFNPELPIASASIGQVYRATVKETNQTVAVKVQRPDAFGSAAIDMFILRKSAAFLKAWKKIRSDLVAVADEFGKQLFDELDYEQEAQNCVRFKELYGGIEGIYVPDVYFDYTGRRVLTQEWIEGEKGPWPEDGKRLLAVGLQCSVLQVLDSGFFHADPHRGNLLKTRDGKLAYLDFGMMANVTSANRYALLGSVFSLQNQDLGMLTESLVTLGFLPDTTNLDVVVPALETAFLDASGGDDIASSKLNFTKLNENLQEISYLFPFKIPPFYSLIIRTLTILEGLALNVDPDFKLIRGAYPFIANQILNSPSGEMRELMKRILISDDNRIDWKQLEQLLSISAASKSGSFEDLKKAQDRSDLKKKLDGEEAEAEITLDVALLIVNFLLSPNGAFLKDALILDIVDTVDSLQLSTLSLPSLATGGLIPRMTLKEFQPDSERLVTLYNIFSRIVDSQESQEASNSEDDTNNKSSNDRSRSNILKFVQQVQETTANPKFREQAQPLVVASLPLLREVSAALVEKQTKRLVNLSFGLFRPSS